MTEFLPFHAALAEILLELLTAELVVDKASKSNAVAKGLEKTDGILEKKHRRKDKKDILEYTRESKDKRGCFTNLENLLDMRVLEET